MSHFDHPSAADSGRTALREIAARQAVCAALALGIIVVAVRIAMVW
jgi:hypothetical protein